MDLFQSIPRIAALQNLTEINQDVFWISLASVKAYSMTKSALNLQQALLNYANITLGSALFEVL
ncbi:hypothetical protein THMIRHAS_20790 [Thiosulfatimonas sediminis]|uniref:Uncharacterized protein n=1 Tax=Thiosulfatimonas sediminis TaxID=2675054 RepID=A0A6F8PX85_9GAMM|nr:hypothetical protein [Thiosulfatimonas sediminis]BBP46706.1 hypothetical protein THMIRHAS_20790 [Thiosulfatimonas sediminis]